MAGIEKICEFSGEYVGHRMYGYKRGQLQIHPKYRKEFRGAGDTLFVMKDDLRFLDKDGSGSLYREGECFILYEPPFESEKEYITYKRQFGYRLVQNYQYWFVAKDSKLQGRVGGVYTEWTMDLATTKRKMKRLLRCRDLKVKFVNSPDELPLKIEP